MENVIFDLAKECGRVKPMHSVNNGPVVSRGNGNAEYFTAAGIPYARNHDASFAASYGGEHTVDVNNIFTNFDADPEDPASYDFTLTDVYTLNMHNAGVECYYRLGSKIEHWSKKYNTLPPKDFNKWAVICEHIIRHYNYGWADGYELGIKYWEIWNEPDLDDDDSTHKRNWGGTKKEFFELYNIASRHLKKCFPDLKIGGPAVCSIWNPNGTCAWMKDFLDSLDGAPLDFFSWHIYANDPSNIKVSADKTREILDSYGYTETESILNEWNYVKGWTGDDWVYSLRMEKSLKGAAFIAGTMADSQYGSIDNLMYYDARIGTNMNGLFDTRLPRRRLKGYYPFFMFGDLYRLDAAVSAESDCANIHAVAAKNAERASLMLTHFDDNDAAAPRDVKLTFKNTGFSGGMKVEFHILDEEHDCELIKEDFVSSDDFNLYLSVPNFSTYFIKFLPLESEQ